MCVWWWWEEVCGGWGRCVVVEGGLIERSITRNGWCVAALNCKCILMDLVLGMPQGMDMGGKVDVNDTYHHTQDSTGLELSWVLNTWSHTALTYTLPSHSHTYRLCSRSPAKYCCCVQHLQTLSYNLHNNNTKNIQFSF